MSDNSWALSIDALLSQHRLKAVYSHRRGRAWPRSSYIRIPPVVDERTYLIALHEIGHCVAPGARLRLDREALAWRWALRRRATTLVGLWYVYRRLIWYLAQAAWGRYRVPPRGAVFWRVSLSSARDSPPRLLAPSYLHLGPTPPGLQTGDTTSLTGRLGGGLSLEREKEIIGQFMDRPRVRARSSTRTPLCSPPTKRHEKWPFKEGRNSCGHPPPSAPSSRPFRSRFPTAQNKGPYYTLDDALEYRK